MKPPFGIGILERLEIWPVLLIPVLIMVPTASVLWFMNEAVRNERLAVRQKWTQLHQNQLTVIRQAFEDEWTTLAADCQRLTEGGAALSFARIVEGGLADSVVVFDPSGKLLYPAPAPGPLSLLQPDPRWKWAREQETRGNPEAASVVYGSMATDSQDANEAAGALQGQIRCLVRAGQDERAIGIVLRVLERFDAAYDGEGRHILASAELLAMELIRDSNDPRFGALAERLKRRLNDYSGHSIPAGQRRFLMGE